MADLKSVEQQIKAIQDRNKGVEASKAWETSLARRAVLVLFTYLAVGCYLRAANIPKPWLNAIVPSVAFMLSTLTLPMLKKQWIKHVYRG
ncbi:MAG: hypothetical protein ABH879_03450 [archaeon]